MASTSTPKLGDRRSFAGSASGTTGRSFTTESSPFLCTRRARTTTPGRFELEVRGVEEVHLPDLSFERVHPQGGQGRSLVGLGHA